MEGSGRGGWPTPAARMQRFPTTIALLVALLSGSSAKRWIEYRDVPTACRSFLAGQGLDERSFAAAVQSLERRSEERELEGENDHLVYFILQSGSFTRRPHIEPGLAARKFVEKLPQAERARYFADRHFLPPVERLPADAAWRLRDFLAAPGSSNERIRYLKSLLQNGIGSRRSAFGYLYSQYARAMRFLYLKEFSGTDVAAVSQLYHHRGHSTDTQVEANFAVYNALAALASAEPGIRCRRALVVGPGLDFAPRTDFVEAFPPQSYQPFALADALIEVRLSELEQLEIDCIDINPRVLRFLKDFPVQPVLELDLFSGVAETEARPFSPDYRQYFESLGRRIGTATSLEPPPPGLERRLRKRLVVRKEAARRIRGDELNIVTQRYDPSPQYDLVVATNVLSYFNPVELLLALINIDALMKPGGFLVHNENREEALSFADSLRLRLVQSRTVLIAKDPQPPLYDTAWIHQKSR